MKKSRHRWKTLSSGISQCIYCNVIRTVLYKQTRYPKKVYSYEGVSYSELPICDEIEFLNNSINSLLEYSVILIKRRDNLNENRNRHN